jgi:putative transposase
MEVKTYYRRQLPHYQQPDSTFFVTFRLANSLPEEVIIHLKEENALQEKLLLRIKDEKDRNKKITDHRKQYFAKFDELLDKTGGGFHWLKDERVAEMLAESIHFRDGKEYELFAYCIMPNHVHLVFHVGRNAVSSNAISSSNENDVSRIGRNGVSSYIVTSILQSLKKYTAIRANRILERTGVFWQHESYDHVIRDEKELERVINYVLNNPVKAGLASTWQEWKWSYVYYRRNGVSIYK